MRNAVFIDEIYEEADITNMFIEQKEHVMYELVHAKDQVMTVLKLALANGVMWTRDTYFPAPGIGWYLSSAKDVHISCYLTVERASA